MFTLQAKMETETLKSLDGFPKWKSGCILRTVEPLETY